MIVLISLCRRPRGRSLSSQCAARRRFCDALPAVGNLSSTRSQRALPSAFARSSSWPFVHGERVDTFSRS
jgi:hypothetical protein